MGVRFFLRELWTFRNIFIVILTPLLLLPIPLVLRSVEAKCAYAILVMAIYWISEALPIAVTSLLPLIMFPMLGVSPAKQVAKNYINDTSMLFVGGLVVALAIETWNLHKRIALRTLLIFGTEPKRLLLGLMVTTWFLSMWISNTATAAMMIPIADAILKQLQMADEDDTVKDNDQSLKMETYKKLDPESTKTLEKTEAIENSTQVTTAPPLPTTTTKVATTTTTTTPAETNKTDSDVTEKGLQSVMAAKTEQSHIRLCKAVCLSIAYSANVGGMGTLTGTGPNLVMKGQSDLFFSEVGLPPPVTFANWMLFGIPLSFINLIFIWFWLIVFELRQWNPKLWCCNKDGTGNNLRVRRLIQEEMRTLGNITFAEILTGVCFLVLTLLWITRDLQSAGGWKNLFKDKYVTDTTAAMFISILLFILPSKVPRFSWKGHGAGGWPTILTWKVVETRLNWGIILLLGGGFAIAAVSRESGLSTVISDNLMGLSSMTPWVMALILGFIVAMMTEITSNTATATILMPIMAELAISIRMNPLYLMFTATLACSYAFMLPVATPPNAIVFATGHLKVTDMVSAGFLINIVCVLTLTMALHTWGEAMFHFTEIPSAFLANSTAIPVTS
ncbi:solute carrier family 13 member 5-like [Octopus sinensis]|uniref:Solute carrier family 13 member 5-like n=1 Tax=Octopus sinensis TaxID=2607531 RepID=A0A6P7U5Q1_9MOLL|nr:solute carrier family 13 member 5-like [Octopus sinensis]